jgi:hypothetical protein
MGPKLQTTRDYDLFELTEYNRSFHSDAVLEESMRKYGFMPSSPIQCVRSSNGKLRIIRGHHRFKKAKELGLQIWYIIDESNKDIFTLEACKAGWSVGDFAYARANAGHQDYIKLLEFQKAHHLTLGAAASLVGGESAGSKNKIRTVKKGSFHAGDMKHAKAVVRITDRCRELEIRFATSTAFINAVSMALRIPDFDSDLFIHRLELNGSQLRKRGTSSEYLEEIESLYNYGARKTRLPVAFRAKELSRQRQESFGKTST